MQAQIEQVGHTGPVPSDEDLRQARDKRDAGWRLIRAAWQGGAGPADTEAEYVASFPGSNNLATAYEAAVRAADELVDRLRREAERVERYAAAQASLRQQEQQRARLDEGLHRTVQELQSLRDDWNAQWQPFPLTPLPPREMLAWLRKQQKWAADCRQLHTASQNAASLRAKIESFQSELDAGLSSVGETPAVSSLDTSSLEKLTAQAATFCQSQDSLQQQHAELNRDLLRVRAELQAATAQAASAERDRAEWLQAWGREIGGLGLAENASPTQAREVIKRLDEWSKAMAAIAALTPRIEEIDSFCGRFARETQALLSAVSPDKAGTPPELAIADLNARLKQAQSQRQRRDDLRERRQQAADNLAQAERTVREKDRLLAQLCEEAGCQHADELAAAEEHSQQRARLESELDRLNRQLAELARGEPLPTFLEAATALPADQLEAELLRLQGQIQEAVREKEAAAEQFVTERNWLQERNGAEQAAEEAERAQGLLAALSSNVRHYARVRLASAALRRAIERYREKNQDPLLARASQTFAELTGGAFQGLRADTDEDGKQVLLGVREKTAETVRVEQMSDGTADQLYLALRLASLERYREQHDPPPFIVDDILIRFDDGRSLATLRALAQLAQRMQVIFFTHHQHLLDLAGQHLPADAWTRHELDSRQQPATV
ncbi:MAG: ATP-binding protein [Pirellulales bacterium]